MGQEIYEASLKTLAGRVCISDSKSTAEQSRII